MEGGSGASHRQDEGGEHDAISNRQKQQTTALLHTSLHPARRSHEPKRWHAVTCQNRRKSRVAQHTLKIGRAHV